MKIKQGRGLLLLATAAGAVAVGMFTLPAGAAAALQQYGASQLSAVSNTITIAEIVNSTITIAEVANNTITIAEVANNTITIAEVANNTITIAEIAAQSIRS